MNSPNCCPERISVPSVTSASVSIPENGARIVYLASRLLHILYIVIISKNTTAGNKVFLIV